MSLASPPLDGQTNSLADWVEFNILSSEYKLYRFSSLVRLVDEEQEEENPDIAEQDATNEGLLESVLEELNLRNKSLSSAYPFYFNDAQTELLLHDELTEGRYIYLYCLLFSHINREDVLIVDPPSSNADRDLMQICSTYAAAGIVYGNAVSFGFPRPDHTGFLQALKDTYTDFGEGEIHNSIPLGAPDNEKDARVDVIAWENSLDGASGCKYILGQVASGNNWGEKSITGEIEPFHSTWFVKKPASTPTPAMFIPFCINNKKGATLHETMVFLTYRYGDVYYRYRLPKHAEDGFLLAKNDINCEYRIDRIDEFHKIKSYVENFLNTLI